MINGYKLWPTPGLFWRTALVTAAMKSISPSAIIFGPMVGIFMEGVILEVFVRLFKGRWPGFILGGALAVSWSLFQKIFVLLMTYGPDFVTLYEQLYLMASKSFGFSGSAPFDLVKGIFIVDLAFGAIVAAFAFRTSSTRRILSLAQSDITPGETQENVLVASVNQNYSILLFIMNLMVLTFGLSYLDDLSLRLGGALVIIYVTLNIFRYARSLQRLKRPQLWIQLIAIMALSGLLLGGWDSREALLSGLETGLNMAIRALLVIFTFSALSIEMRNPIIISGFTRMGMGVLFESITLAFEVLPRLLKLVSGLQRIWRHPFKTLNRLLGALEVLRREHLNRHPRVIILTGSQGDGKTEMINKIIDHEDCSDLQFFGFYSRGAWVEGERDRYHLVNIQTREAVLLCDREKPRSELQAGPFNFRAPGLDFGCRTLDSIPSGEASAITIIDEIGHLELRDEGWGKCMSHLVDRGEAMIWTVRPALLQSVLSKWTITPVVIDVRETTAATLIQKIRSFLL